MLIGRAVLLAAPWSVFVTAVPVDHAEDHALARPRAAVQVRQAVTTSPPTPAADVTVTAFVTTTIRADSTVTVPTTVFTTLFSTIVLTTTDFVTSTVTSSNVDTATITNYVTSTVLAKRWLVLPPEETRAAAVPEVEAVPTVTAVPAAVPTLRGAERELDLIRRQLERYGLLAKRATVTTTSTVTAIFDGVTTVFAGVTSTVIGTTTSEFHITSTITTTTFANAKTTVTVTSTLVVTSTSITISGPQTVATAPPTGNYGPSATAGSPSSPTGGGSSSSNSGGGSGELSTGAKIGIGAGVGGAALLAIIAAALLYMRRRKKAKLDPNSLDHMGGMSEVPVGGTPPAVSPLPTHQRMPPPKPGMAEMDAVQAAPAYKRHSELADTGKPATPELGGESSPGRAAEMDSTQAPAMGYGSGPVQDVYEMPAQPYR